MVKKISLIYGSERFFDVCNENLIISIAFYQGFCNIASQEAHNSAKIYFWYKDIRNEFF